MIFPNSCSINYLIVLATAQLPSCPEAYGEQAYAHPDACDQFFLCTNGTLTLETCENGLIFGKGAVHNHCGYNWHYETDCAGKKYDRELLYHDCVSFFFQFCKFYSNSNLQRYLRVFIRHLWRLTAMFNDLCQVWIWCPTPIAMHKGISLWREN